MVYYKKGNFTIVPNSEYLMAVSTTAQSIFLWLCVHADAKGQCFPSRKLLASLGAMSVRTVDKSIVELIESNLISKSSRERSDGSYSSNLYQIELHGALPSAGAALRDAGAAHLELNPSNQSLTKVKESSSKLDPQVLEVFENAKVLLNLPKAKPLPARMKLIARRLQDSGFESVKAALLNVSRSEWHMGKNDNGWKADIEFVLRNPVQVEKWANKDSAVSDIPSEDNNYGY